VEVADERRARIDSLLRDLNVRGYSQDILDKVQLVLERFRGRKIGLRELKAITGETFDKEPICQLFIKHGLIDEHKPLFRRHHD
jgi:hypothetical protein